MRPPAPSPRHVFTPEWIEGKKRRFGHTPDHARPRMYWFWTSDEAQHFRDQIEAWVDLLSPDERGGVISRLHTEEQYQQAFNELAVGDSLRRMGHVIEYEVEFQGLTPDWLACPSGGGSQFLIEVVSSMPPEGREKCDEGWDGLRRRLAGVPGNAFLYVQPPFYDGEDTPVPAPTGSRQREIVRAVQRWLETEPPEGEGLQIDGMVIRYVGRNSNQGTLSCGIGCLPYWVDGVPLRASVNEKAKKYRGIVEATRIPFVVCVVPDFGTGRGLQDLETAVLGTEHCRAVPADGGGVSQEYYRSSDGLFAEYPSLSAATLAHWDGERITHTVLSNPNATYPLEPAAFAEPIS